MNANFLTGSFLLALAVSAGAIEPLRFDEVSLLVRMREPDAVITRQLTLRRLLRPLASQQEATLKAQGASDALIQALRNPSFVFSDDEAAIFEAQREQQKKTQDAQKEANPTDFSAKDEQVTKDDFRVLNVRFGQPINLSQWGGPNNEIAFYAKKELIGQDMVVVVLTDNTRTFTDSVTTNGAAIGPYGASTRYTTVQSSYSPKKFLTINKSSPTIVPKLGNLYPVYEAGGVSLYYMYISAEAADSVKVAVRAAKK